MKFNLSVKEGIKKILIPSYTTFVFGLIFGNLFSAIITILPANIVGFGSTKLSVLGYVAHCAFAPWSTLISLSLVGLGIFLLIKWIKYLKINNITFIELIKMYVVAVISILILSTCFPFIMLLIGLYICIKFVKYIKPNLQEVKTTKSNIKN